MTDEKARLILKSNSDLTDDELSVMSDREAWALVYELTGNKEGKNKLQVCFTGFSITEKAELSELAKANDFKIVSSVTKGLNFLCVGDNAGPSKLEKAKAQGSTVLSADGFRLMIKTGEVQSE